MATRRRGTVVLVSDMMTQDRIEALRVLAGARMRVVVLHTLSGDERDPPLGGELTLVDSESDQRLVVHINRGLRDAYLSRLEAMTRELKESCRAYGIAFVEIDCRTPLQTLVMGDLRRHGLVAG